MKTVRQLVDFIFHSSQEQEVVLQETDRNFLFELNQVEPVQVVDKKPLEVALKAVGLTGIGTVEVDHYGPYVTFETAEEYAAVLNQLFDEGKMYDLAARGWVASYSDDTSNQGDTSNFRINFLSLGEIEPGNTKGHEAEDADKLAMDRMAVDAFKANNELEGRKHQLHKKDDEKVAESQSVIDSLEKAADVVARMLKRT